MSGACKVEYFRFVVFHNETSVEENSRHNIVATKEKGRRKAITLLLGNKKTVVYKRKDIRRNFFFKIFNFFLNVLIMGAIYITEIIGERAEP